MKILVFGKDGQLGKAFQNLLDASLSLSRDHDIHYVGRTECDLNHSLDIEAALNAFQPDLIINAAAYTAVDKAEQESNLAFSINATAPAVMARYAANHGATFLHYSTDYVFDGSGVDFYSENQPLNPLGAYGKSKAAGELAIEEAFDHAANFKARYAIFRASWVYGMGGNFIRTILRLAKEREELRVINDQFGVPTDATWLAKMSLTLCIDEQGRLRDFPSGIYHAVPAGETSWHGLAHWATQVAMEAGVAMKASGKAISPIPATEYPLPAPRPMNSRMSTIKLQKALKDLGLVSKFPEWDVLVRSYVTDLAKNKLI